MGLSLEHFLPSLKVMARGTLGFWDIRGPLTRVLSEEVIPTYWYNASVLPRLESNLFLLCLYLSSASCISLYVTVGLMVVGPGKCYEKNVFLSQLTQLKRKTRKTVSKQNMYEKSISSCYRYFGKKKKKKKIHEKKVKSIYQYFNMPTANSCKHWDWPERLKGIVHLCDGDIFYARASPD